jgi:tripartite-type tricarboxylate transporter receptor subunit TctC
MSRTAIASAAFAAAFSIAACAEAQQTAAWPERPVRLIVPFPGGSATDVAVRILEQAMTPKLGQSIVIDNRSGASGSIGVDAVAKATPDGYTTGLVTVSTHAVAPGLGRKLPYNPLEDFTPIGMIGSTPYVLVTYPGLGVGNLKDLIALAKAKPGQLNYGSAGPASMAHLAAALLATETGADIVHVPYRSSVHAVTDIIAGRIQMQFATIPPSIELIATAKLRAVAVSGARRSSTMPDVPTVAEQGLPGFEATLWMALVAPAKTPPEIAAKLNAALNAALSDAKLREALLVQGVEPEPGTPAALTTRVKTDIAKWREVIVKAGIKAE